MFLREWILSAEYEKALQEQFGRLNKDNFKVQFAIKTLFVCGGIVHPVDKQLPPGSFRDRLMRYTAEKGIEFHDYIVLAEEFKDYYVDGNYRDLLTFEDDIASLSTLVIIFLESAGSLVELGLYCSRPAFFKKLLVVVPKDELETEDSFIYLGPLKFIESKVENSFCTYPFPSRNDSVQENEPEYDNYYLEDLCHNVEEKIKNTHKTENFKEKISGHISYLIAEIIRLSFPIMLGEIEKVLKHLGIEVQQGTLQRILYLLRKMRFIDKERESTNTYYYPIHRDKKLVNFGRTTDNKIIDDSTLTMALRLTYVTDDSQLARRRVNVLQNVVPKMEEGN